MNTIVTLYVIYPDTTHRLHRIPLTPSEVNTALFTTALAKLKQESTLQNLEVTLDESLSSLNVTVTIPNL